MTIIPDNSYHFTALQNWECTGCVWVVKLATCNAHLGHTEWSASLWKGRNIKTSFGKKKLKNTNSKFFLQKSAHPFSLLIQGFIFLPPTVSFLFYRQLGFPWRHEANQTALGEHFPLTQVLEGTNEHLVLAAPVDVPSVLPNLQSCSCRQSIKLLFPWCQAQPYPPSQHWVL